MPIYLTFALALSIVTIVQAGRVLLTLYALKLGAQPFAVGILTATFSVLPILISWQVGRFSDRFGCRWLLMVGTISGTFGMLLPYYVSGLPALYIAGVMNGLLFAFSGASLQNLVGLLSHPETSARNFSNYSVLISATGFLGPLLAGFSIDHSGYAVACLYLVLTIESVDRNPIPGAVIAIQTFGDVLGFNPHCHILVTDGCFYAKGMFRVAPPLELRNVSCSPFRVPIARLAAAQAAIRAERMK